MTDVRSDFCLLAKLHSAPQSGASVLSKEPSLHASGSCASFLGFIRPSNGHAGHGAGGGGLVRDGAPIGYLSGCWETVVFNAASYFTVKV